MPTATHAPLAWQPTLTGTLPVMLDAAPIERHHLDDSCWVDVATGWLVGSDDLMAELLRSLDWQGGSRPMYDRLVAVPRLSAFLDLNDRQLPPVVGSMAEVLGARYERTFERVGCNLYRSGADSVAWHADRIGRTERNPVVALVSLGARRPFRLRPRHGGPSQAFNLGGGDLLVMGGACQHRWEHCVPKVRQGAPRISLGFRHGHEPSDLWRLAGRSFSSINPESG